ncbi:MAG: filamentous hemagglutinin N-terminal domain-containing protein [Burkholderiaceae bacterium]|nr:filamentous hemagglutinin N-terminal domain-containing protein [Burkholderiaceae bacterium]
MTRTDFKPPRSNPINPKRLRLTWTMSLILSAYASHGSVTAQTLPGANQLPQGGNVTAGSAQINQSGNVMNIDQSTQKAIINWQEFNVGKDATVNFNQPGARSATLNRVLDSNPSQIFGRIVAPGQVILINPNGAYFAPSASVDVGGLIATTHELADKDFLEGNYAFKRNGASGNIINDGELKAKLDGYIALMAPEVRNQGVIVAERGTVALASGEHIQLDFGTGNKLQGITVTEQDFDAQIENRHAIIAEGGLVILSARATAELRASVIKNSGQIVASAGANTVTQKGGRIVLEGNDIEVTEGSELIATGPKGGGEILVGGDWQGGANEERRVFEDPNKIHQATKVTVQANTTIDVSATDNGDGGTVVVWSDITNPDAVTTVQGEILAKGGENGGDGGQIETSGAVLTVDGLRVDAGSPSGRAGLWLLDPYDYVIDSAAAQTIGKALETTDVTVTTTVQNSSYGAASTQGAGNILLNYPIIKFQNSQLTTLSLKANRDIDMNGWSITGRLNLVMWSDTDGASGGAVSNLGNITSFGGFVWVGGGSTSTQFEGIDVPNGPTTGTSGAPLTVTGSINTFGGDIFIWSGAGTSSNALKFDGTTAVLSSGFLEISAEDANGVSAGDITIRANGFEFSGFPSGQKPRIAAGGGSVAILPSVTGGSFGQTIRTSLFDFEGELAGLQIGAAGNTADLLVDSVISPSIAGPVSLFGNTVNVNQTITTTGSASASVSITGNTINLGANIIGTGAHVLDGDVVIQGAPGVERTVEGTSVLFGSTVNGTNLHSLSIVGDADFSSAVGAVNPLSILRVYGSTRLGGNVNTTWLQEYRGPVTLVGNRSLSSDTIVFRSSIDGTTPGSDHLQANVQTSLIFDGDVGGSIKLGSLAVSGPTTLGGDITTAGALSLAGMTKLTDHSTLTGSGLRLAAVQLDGQVLTAHESGVGLISGVVSDGIAPGGALTMSGSGVLTLTANGTYTGLTTISNGLLVISHDAPTTNSSGFKGPGKLIIRSVSDDFNRQFFSEGWNFGPDLGELTIGRFDKSADGVNDADVIITRAITLAGDVFIYGAHVYLNGDLTVLGGGNLPVSVRLQASASVSTKGIEAPKSIIINNSVGSGHVFVSGSISAGADFRVLAGGTIFLGGDVTTTGGQLYDAPVVVSGSRELSGTSISFLSVNGTILGQDDLDITGDTYFLGEVGIASPLRRLSVVGNTVVGGDIRTLDSLVLSDTTILTGNRTLSGVGVNLEAVSLNGNRLTVNEGGAGAISGVVSDGSTTGGSLTKIGVGTLTLTSNSTYTGATTISVGELVLSNDSPQTSSSGFFGAGWLVIEPTSNDFTNTFSTTGWTFAPNLGYLRIGKASSFDGNADADVLIDDAISIAGSVELFGGSVVANQSITATGSSSFLTIVGRDSVSTVAVTVPGHIVIQSRGAINVAGSLRSSDDVVIWSERDVTLTGPLVSGVHVSIASQGDIFSSAVTATENIFIANSDGGGDIDLAGVLNAGGWLRVVSAGTIVLGADATSGGSQDYSGSVRLSGDRTLDASYAVFLASVNATVSGQQALTIRGDAAIYGSVGGTVPLKSLSVSGVTQLGNNITTTGTQIYSGLMILPEAADLPVTATTDRTLTGHGISLSAIDLEGHRLKIAESGSGTISGVVSDGGVSGGGLLKLGAGTLTLTANGTYTGTATISSGRMVLSNDAPSTRSSGFTGAGELVIEPTSDDFASDFSTAGWVFGADLGGLTIGKSSSADGADDVNILVSQPVSIAGNILFTGGGVTVSGDLATTGNFSSIRIDARQDIAVTSVEAVNRIDLFSIASNIDVNGRLSAQTVEIRSRDGLSSIVGAINADRLYMTGPSSISAVISTTSDQTYFDLVTVAGHSSLSAPNVTFFSQVNGVASGQQDLTITGNTLLNSPVGSIIALRSLFISGDTQLSGDVTAAGQIDFVGNTYLVGDRSLRGSGISLGAVTLNGHTLTIDESSSGTISGVVSDGMTLGGSLVTAGLGQLKLTANSTYTGATIISGRELVLVNDAPTTRSSGFSGSGSLVIEPAGSDFSNTFSTAGWTFAQNLGRLTIGKRSGFDGVADAAIVIASPISIDGEIQLRGAAITTGSNSIRSARSGVALETSGDITVAAVQSASRMRLWSYSGDIHVTDQLSSAGQILLGALGAVSINGAVSADSLFIASDALIAADISTTQTQQFGGEVTVSGSVLLTAADVLFMGRVDGVLAGQEALTIDANARFSQDIGLRTALKSLSVSGSSMLGSSITTTDEQIFTGPSQLLHYVSTARLSASSVSFLSSVNADSSGVQSLIVNGNARFNGAVGNTASLQSLSVLGDTELGADITATGSIGLSGSTTLTGNRTLTGTGVNLGGVVLDGYMLTVAENGFGTISGVISDGGPSSGTFTKAGQGTLALTANASYTGSTSIAGGTLILVNDAPSTSSSEFSGSGRLVIEPASDDFATNFSTINWIFRQSLGEVTIGKPSSADGVNDVDVTFADAVSIDGYIAAFGKTIRSTQGLTASGSSIVYLVASDSLLLADVTAGGFISIQNQGSNPVHVTGTLQSGDDVSIVAGGEIDVAAMVVTDQITLANTAGSSDIRLRGSVSTGSLNVRSHGRIVLGGDVTSRGAQDYDGSVVLSGDRALQGTYARFFSTIDGATAGQEALSITGDAVFVGHVGTTVPLESLSVSAATALGGDITTTGAQTYGGSTTIARTLNVGRTLTGHGISLGAINLEGEMLTIAESGVGTISGIVQDGSLSGGGLTKAGSGGWLTLTANGSYTGPTTVSGGVLILSNDAPSTRSSGFSGAGWLVITSTSDDFSAPFSTQGWNFQPDLGRLTIGSFFTGADGLNDASVFVADSITVSDRLMIFAGDITIRDQIIVTGGQAWQGTSYVLIEGSGDVSVSSVIAAGDVLIGAGGDVDINGSLEADGLLGIGSNQSIFLYEDIVGNQVQFLGDVYFSGDRTVTAPTVEFFNNVDATLAGQDSLTVVGSTTFDGTVGGIQPLRALTVSGNLLLGANITTTGPQSFTGDTTLNGDRILTGAGIRWGAIALDGHTLTIHENGSGTITGVVSDGSAPGGSLIKSGSGTLTLQANGFYTGATNILSGSLILSSDSPSSMSSDFSGPGLLYIQPAGASFQSTLRTSSWRFDQSLGGLTIGKSGNMANILVDQDVAIGGSITLIGGEITLDRSLRVGLDQDIVLAAGADFINNAGGSALATQGAGRWIIYAADSAGNVYGGLDSTNEAIWNETYDTLAPDAVLAGNRYVFAGGAVNAVTLTTTDATKVYGESIDLSGHYVLSATGYDGEPGVYLATTGLRTGSLSDVFSISPIFTSSSAPASSGVGTAPISTTPGVVRDGFSVTYRDLGLLNVTKRPIIIAAQNSQQKVYGEIDPGLVYTTELTSTGRGLYGTDEFSGTLQRTSGENVGTYEIGQGTLDNSNYDISFVSASFTITPKPITVTAVGQRKLYGEADPLLTYVSDVGLVGADRFAGALSRAVGENVGSYWIGQNTLAIDDGNGGNNYALTYTGAAFQIEPRPIVSEANFWPTDEARSERQADQSVRFVGQTVTLKRVRSLLSSLVLAGQLQTETMNDVGSTSAPPEVDQQLWQPGCIESVMQSAGGCSSAGDNGYAAYGDGFYVVDSVR